MIKLITYVLSLKKHRATKFILYELLICLIFALAYWISDILMFNYSEMARSLNLGSITGVNSFFSYLYFALITQTTVGYSGILPDGGNIVTTHSMPLRILVMVQLISIILLTGWTLF